MSLLKRFCNVDDFWQVFQARWPGAMLASGAGPGVRSPGCSPVRS